MSHVVTTTTRIRRDYLPQLVAAAQQCGLEFRENQTTYRWYGTWVNDYGKQDAAYREGLDPKTYGQCEHAFSVAGKPEAYELGVVADPKDPNYYRLVWDFWGSSGQQLQACVGSNCTKLLQKYNEQVVSRVRAEAGSSLLESRLLPDGSTEFLIEISDEQVALQAAL